MKVGRFLLHTYQNGMQLDFAFSETNQIYLTVLVVDTTPAKNIIKQGGQALLQCTLDAIITFSNAHLMQSTLNKLGVLACNSNTT